MVLINLHLIALKPGHTVQSFLRELHKKSIQPIVQAVVVRWMIMPSHLPEGHVLGRHPHWDLFLILDGELTSISIPQDLVLAEWTTSCGVSSRALLRYGADNDALLHPGPGSGSVVVEPPPQTLDTSTSVSAELESCIALSLPARLRDRPVSMLHLLSLAEGKEDQYRRYGAVFRDEVGSRHGAAVKLVGKVVGVQARDDGWDQGWDEVAFVHYPSVRHFVAMAASQDYQDANRKYRQGALRDSFMLCVMEIDNQGEIIGDQPIRGKL